VQTQDFWVFRPAGARPGSLLSSTGIGDADDGKIAAALLWNTPAQVS
jgi:hypothetical protein